jgi:hypothetical protein
MASKNEGIPVETKIDEGVKMEVDQEEPDAFQSPSTHGDLTDEDDGEWGDILPPPPVPTVPEDADERYEVIFAKMPIPRTPVTVASTGDNTPTGHLKLLGQVVVPDFSQYKTNVARRLWEAQETAETAEQQSSADLVPLKREFQQYRKKMRTLIHYLDEYQEAMLVLKDKRRQVSGRNLREE